MKKLYDFFELEALANDEARSCTRKHWHRTEEKARNVAAVMAQKGYKGLEVYKCRHCEYWHIGHKRRIIAPSL